MNVDKLDKAKILEMLRSDEHYYGEFGNNFLSNSSIKSLIHNPKDFRKPGEPNINYLLGSAFHTMVLEPERIGEYKFIDAASRRTKEYKAAANGEMLLLESDRKKLEWWKDCLDGNDLVQSVLKGSDVEREVPAIGEIYGEMWKGKADILNHGEKLIVDLKTTADISKFHLNSKKYNYDSQAYIYKTLFGYDFAFLAVDKNTGQIGFFDCSDNFYAGGKEKVIQAVHAYRMYFKDGESFDWDNFLITETL